MNKSFYDEINKLAHKLARPLEDLIDHAGDVMKLQQRWREEGRLAEKGKKLFESQEAKVTEFLTNKGNSAKLGK